MVRGKPLLTTPLKVEDIITAIKLNFPEEVINYAIAFAFTLKLFSKYSSSFSIGSFVDELTSFKGEITIKADVPQEAGMGSSASFFSAIILNIYVGSLSPGCHENSHRRPCWLLSGFA